MSDEETKIQTVKSKHAKKTETYNVYLYKILKQVYPTLGMSKQAMAIMDSYIKDMFERIATESANLAQINHKTTIDARCIQTATTLQFPQELAKHAIAEGIKAINKYTANISSDGGTGGKKKKRKSQSERAGLKFPVGRIARYLKEGNYASRISGGAALYLAAVLEYLAAELMEKAGYATKDNKKARIIPRHIMLAIKNDDEFSKLLNLVIIMNSGTMPYIAQELMPMRFKKKTLPTATKFSASMAY
eukprot:543088_1